MSRQLEALAAAQPDRAETHQLRVQIAAAQLIGLLRMKAAAGHGCPLDARLLAALHSWDAGDLS